MLNRTLFFAIATMALCFIVRAESASVAMPDFAPRQMWSIKSAVPTTAKVVVGRIEAWNGKVVVHVSVIDIPAAAGTAGGGRSISIDHIPFDKSALSASVDQLVSTGVSPGFEGGYEHWRTDTSAGIFEISVSQVITLMLETVIRGRT